MNRRQLLATTGAVASLGLCAGVVAGVPGCTPAPATEPIPSPGADPLLALIGTYRAGLVAYNAAGDLSAEDDAALAAETYEPAYDRLSSAPPAPTTLAGALAAIRLVAHEAEHGGPQPDLTANVLRAALAYFEGRAA